MRRLWLMALVLAGGAQVGAQQAQHEIALQHLRAGQVALQQERYEQAERAFKNALELDSRLELAHYGLGQTYMATRRYAEAVRAFVDSRAAFTGNETDRLAHNVDAERRLDDQIRTLRDQRRGLESGRLRTLNVTAAINQIDNQIQQLEGLRRRQPGSAPIVPAYISVALGSAFFRTSAFADAEREWRAALAVDPAIGEVHNNLAVIYMLTGRYDQADQAIGLAEKAGFKVNPQLKDDLKKRRGGSS
jgi:tetratricopeptide (TPR) repeat protein